MKYTENEISSIRERLQYCETSPTGLIWKVKVPHGKHNVGDVAGFVESHGYSRVSINGKRYQATHCILILFGETILAETEVDHIDGNPSNNNVKNLRIVKHEVNMRNKKRNRKNQLDFTGITLHTETNRVLAYFSVNSKQYTKYFGIKKYGLIGAIEKAKAWRIEMLKKLTKDYTNRHIFN